MSIAEPINKGATRAGGGRYIFELAQLAGMDAGTGYSSANGPVVEGDRMQVALVTMKRGTGARPHSHPNEQWIYLLKGRTRVTVDHQPETIAAPGTLIYLPADVVHAMVALPEEEVVFFTCKDMSHGIAGKAADGTMSGPAYDPGFEAD